jgi:effector-binding domain-containing protein
MLRIPKAAAVGVAASALLMAALVPCFPQGETPPAAPAPPAPAENAHPAPAPTQPGDAFGEEVTMAAKPIVYMKGTATWDNAYETLVDAFKSVRGYIDREKLKADGPPMTIYLATDDTGFQFEAAIRVAEPPKDSPKGDLAVGTSPDGRALKFVHRGSYDSMDTTYDAITNYLDQKGLEAKDLFIEQYVTDPTTTPEDKLVIEVFVPVK